MKACLTFVLMAGLVLPAVLLAQPKDAQEKGAQDKEKSAQDKEKEQKEKERLEKEQKDKEQKEKEDKEREQKKERALLRITLIFLEKRVWEGMVGQKAEVLGALLTDDYQEIGGLTGSPMTKVQMVLGASDFRNLTYRPTGIFDSDPQAEMIPLSKDAALLSYNIHVAGSIRGEELAGSYFGVTSAWVNRDGRWMSAFRQWTVKAPPAPPTIDAIKLFSTRNSLLYEYEGKDQLEDVRVS